MPTYTDPTTGKKFTSPEPLTPDELEEAFGAVGTSPKWTQTNQNEFNPELINKLPLVDRMQRAAMQPIQQIQQGMSRSFSSNAGNVAAGATDIVGGISGAVTLVPNLAGMAIKSVGVSDYVNPITAPIQAAQGYIGAIEGSVDKLLYSDKDRMQAQTDEAIKASQDIQKNPFQSIMSANKRTAVSGMQNAMRNIAMSPMMEVGGKAIGGTVSKTGAITENVGKYNAWKKGRTGMANVIKLDRETLSRAEPYIAEASREMQQQYKGGITKQQQPISLEVGKDVLSKKMNEIWNDKLGGQVARNATEQISLRPAQDALLNEIDNLRQQFDPKVADAIMNEATKYDGSINLKDAWQQVSRLNEETRAYQAGDPFVQAQLRTGDPTLYAKVKVKNALLDEITNVLERNGETNVRDLRKDYGALSEVTQQIQGQINKGVKNNKTLLQNMPFFRGGVAGSEVGLITNSPSLGGGAGLAIAIADATEKSSKVPPKAFRKAFNAYGRSGLKPRYVTQPPNRP